MAVRRPTLEQLRSVAEDLGMHMGDEELKSYDALMQANYAAYDAVDAMPDYVPAVKYPRTPGYRPEGEENKYNAWYVKTEIKGAPSGKLAGKKIALKDNVSLAGVPMMNGASTLEGYMPDIDATIVTRILDAGGTIVGKTHCEYFCFSGGSHTCAAGAVHNPHKMGYSSGGSSSGSAVVVATGEADMAIGGDQGGSIRIPASFCGIYGMKGTHGLVPYTGVMPIEMTHRPHRTDDPQRPRQRAAAGGAGRRGRARSAAGPPKVANYTEASAAAPRAAHRHRQGRLRACEFRAESTPRSGGAELFRKLGATVDEISVPMHWGPGDLAADRRRRRHRVHMKGNGMGTNWRGLYNTTLLDAHCGWRTGRTNCPTASRPRCWSANIDQALSRPFLCQGAERSASCAPPMTRRWTVTTCGRRGLPRRATPIPPPDAPREIYIQRWFEMAPCTAPFERQRQDPAMTIPCGMSGGLPI